MKRRRFLTISAAAIGGTYIGSRFNKETHWQGLALGSEASITLTADPELASETLKVVQSEITRAENIFSLYNPQSEISQLNKFARLQSPSADFKSVIEMSHHAWQATEGYFDPTIQPLWLGSPSHGQFGDFDLQNFTFSSGGMALTLNGIAQGYLTDRISTLLSDHGFKKHLVNMGEFRSENGRYVLDIQTQAGRSLERIALKNASIATSSPFAMPSQAHDYHILDPFMKSTPRWRTVSVMAQNAAMADAYSTAFCFMNQKHIEKLVHNHDEINAVWLENLSGQKVKLG